MKKILCLLPLGLAACVTTTPPTAVHQPMTIRPEAHSPAAGGNGSIYSMSNARPLFEDRRARFVGDIITINIAEKVQASKKSGTTAERSHAVDAAVPTLVGTPFKGVSNLDVAASDSNKFSGKGENSSTADFTSTITTTVIEVLPNGNLLVSGEKQIAVNQGNEFIRFSGVVNPVNVTGSNTVQSTQVADARIEYRANGYIDETERMGWLQRFFMTALPF